MPIQPVASSLQHHLSRRLRRLSLPKMNIDEATTTHADPIATTGSPFVLLSQVPPATQEPSVIPHPCQRSSYRKSNSYNRKLRATMILEGTRIASLQRIRRLRLCYMIINCSCLLVVGITSFSSSCHAFLVLRPSTIATAAPLSSLTKNVITTKPAMAFSWTTILSSSSSTIEQETQQPLVRTKTRTVNGRLLQEEWTSSGTTTTPSARTRAENSHWYGDIAKALATMTAVAFLFTHLLAVSPGPVYAENELSARYGQSGLDTTLVDQACFQQHCSLQAKACLQDDPSCRKGLTCTAKCLGDNSCITGCMARYGDSNLDELLKCTIEDHSCIKVAILEGGADIYGQEPKPPAPTITNFNVQSLEGSWYKVMGYNPNYDCYACQRNTFSRPAPSPSSELQEQEQQISGFSLANLSPASWKERLISNDRMDRYNHKSNILQMEVEFSMPHLLPDGLLSSSSSPIDSEADGSIWFDDEDDKVDSAVSKSSIGLNDYHTREIMVFDQPKSNNNNDNNNQLSRSSLDFFTIHPGTKQEVSYARTAHSEGEMFGLKFWENWYILGENDAVSSEEFKFIYYNGKTRQNTYEGAFVYSRTKELSAESLRKVYRIAQQAGMDPNQFCRIRNGCFKDDGPTTLVQRSNQGSTTTSPWMNPSTTTNPFRGILASTKISELLGVEPVAAQDTVRRGAMPTAEVLLPSHPDIVTTAKEASTVATSTGANNRAWWYEVGDYLENPHRHFKVMNQLRKPVDWPDDVDAN